MRIKAGERDTFSIHSRVIVLARSPRYDIHAFMPHPSSGDTLVNAADGDVTRRQPECFPEREPVETRRTRGKSTARRGH